MIEIIDYEVLSGEDNMNKDEWLLDKNIEDSSLNPILRLYGWEPACVSLGRNQKNVLINEEYCLKNNIDIVTRPSGGKALFHDKELTYCFICNENILDNEKTVIQSYKEISNIFIKAFLKLGLELEIREKKEKSLTPDYCMTLTTGADLSFENRKLIGSAQFRKKNYIMQHGSILLDIDYEKLDKIFNKKIDDTKLITLKEINPDISLQTLCNTIKTEFQNKFN